MLRTTPERPPVPHCAEPAVQVESYSYTMEEKDVEVSEIEWEEVEEEVTIESFDGEIG